MHDTVDFAVKEPDQDVTLSVVGRWPGHRPYLGIYTAAGMIGHLDHEQMVALRDALTAAVKHRPPAEEPRP